MTLLKNHFEHIYLQRMTSFKRLGTLKCEQMEIGNKSVSNYSVENNHFCAETNKREPAVHILLHVILRHQ